MAEEILNIEHNTKLLILKALNQERTVCDAARALGLSERNLYFKMQEYRIKRERVWVVKDKYKIVNTI